MSDTVVAAALTAAAAVLCQIIISARASSLITYRVEILEKKLDKLGEMGERLCLLEENHRRTADRITHLSEVLPDITQ